MSGVKTFSNETSERYALALYQLANEKLEVDDLERNVVTLLEICKKNLEFVNFLKNPTNQIDTQKKVFKEISKITSFGKTFDNFIQLVIAKRRIFFLEKILKRFIKLCSTKKGIIDAMLTSSKDLSRDEQTQINKEISQAINSNVDFKFKVDKTLISGVKIQVGSLLIDTSIKNKLKRIKQSMIEN